MSGGTVTDIADRTGLPKSTVYNHLQTLLANQYVTRSGEGYRLGLRFLEHGGYTRDRMDIFQIAKGEIEDLATETGELVNLLVEEHGRGVYLYRERGEQAVTLDSYLGKRQGLHSTAFGKAMLAYMPDDRVHRILDRHGMPPRTERTITDRDDLFEELAEIRDRKFAYDDEESLEGLRCVASPILTQDSEVLGAVSVSGPISRLSGDRFDDEIPDLLRSTTNVIEINMTYT
jgi:DNA-binding IclR family transcriptional regulator